jgi:hypothetical protein
MIEANQPNACNMCHTDKPIDWTLRYLKDWYKSSYDENKLSNPAIFPDRGTPAAVAWLKSSDPALRLVAADCLARKGDRKALPQLVGALDDPYLINRQFAGRGLEQMLGLRLADFDYHFYMTSDERSAPLAKLRARLGEGQ